MNNMVISSNEQATRIHGMYNRNVGQMNAAMTRIATAQKINSAKDNASVWAISQKMRERMRANDQANQNVQNDSALLKTAQGGLDNTLSILNTLKERAVNAANDSNISGDRAKIAEEVRQLVTQIDENANRVKFNGRVLLNGAGETADTTSTGGISGADAPKAVTATGTYGDMAVYSLTGLKTADGTDLATTTALTNLTDADGNVLFRAGDRISFSWTENGKDKEASLLVESTTTVANMFAKLPGGSATVYAPLAETTLTATDENGVALTAGTPGFYYQGTANTNVSNIAIGVKDASGNVKKDTQALLELNPIQQSYGDQYKASNLVYNASGLATSYVTTLATSSAGSSRLDTIALDNTTEFYRFSTDISSNLGTDKKDWSGMVYELTINDKAVQFKGSDSIDDINKLLQSKGIDVRLQFAKAGDRLYYDGDEVTKGTYGASALYTAADAGLKVIAGSDMEITTLKIESKTNPAGDAEGIFKAGSSNTYDISHASAKIKTELLRDDTDASSTSKTDTSAEMLPRGQELQFFVGGEQNFGVNFAIGKATAQNLFNMSNEEFAKMFNDKDTANEAIGVIDNAISKTLIEQTRLGAMEARLGYTSDNLVTMNENLESGVAAYTGSDMAKEMTEYMKYSVVSQAAQYMLANAGQNAYNVLQLLQP